MLFRYWSNPETKYIFFRRKGESVSAPGQSCTSLRNHLHFFELKLAPTQKKAHNFAIFLTHYRLKLIAGFSVSHGVPLKFRASFCWILWYWETIHFCRLLLWLNICRNVRKFLQQLQNIDEHFVTFWDLSVANVWNTCRPRKNDFSKWVAVFTWEHRPRYCGDLLDNEPLKFLGSFKFRPRRLARGFFFLGSFVKQCVRCTCG